MANPCFLRPCNCSYQSMRLSQLHGRLLFLRIKHKASRNSSWLQICWGQPNTVCECNTGLLEKWGHPEVFGTQHTTSLPSLTSIATLLWRTIIVWMRRKTLSSISSYQVFISSTTCFPDTSMDHPRGHTFCVGPGRLEVVAEIPIAWKHELAFRR